MGPIVSHEIVPNALFFTVDIAIRGFGASAHLVGEAAAPAYPDPPLADDAAVLLLETGL